MTGRRLILALACALCLAPWAPPARAQDADLKRAIAAREDGRHLEAEAILRDLLGRNPGSRDVLVQLGLTFLRASNLRDAYAFLQTAAVHYPEDAAVHFHLAEIYYRAGLRDQEMDALLETIRLNPDDLDAHRHLAHVLVNHGDLYAAAFEFDLLIARAEAQGVAPHPSVLYTRALIHERHGKKAEAERLFRNFLFLSPDGEEADAARAGLERLRAGGPEPPAQTPEGARPERPAS